MVNFYHRIIQFATELQLRLQLLIKINKKKDTTPIQWIEDTENAFTELKPALANDTLLAHPDEKCRIVLCTDASSAVVIRAALR